MAPIILLSPLYRWGKEGFKTFVLTGVRTQAYLHCFWVQVLCLPILLLLNLASKFHEGKHSYFYGYRSLTACMSVHHWHAVPRRLTEGIGLPGTGVKTVESCHVTARSPLSMLLTSSNFLALADISLLIHCLHKLNFGFLFKSSHILILIFLSSMALHIPSHSFKVSAMKITNVTPKWLNPRLCSY